MRLDHSGGGHRETLQFLSFRLPREARIPPSHAHARCEEWEYRGQNQAQQVRP
jgi:hypothetical protein